jgi:hypothetical protein
VVGTHAHEEERRLVGLGGDQIGIRSTHVVKPVDLEAALFSIKELGPRN